MFRKNEGAIAEWSPENVRKCAERQREILTAVWSALKTGGMLIYSTCTYNRTENEENVQWIIRELGAELLNIKIENEWGITPSDFGYRFYPHKTRGEGFFLSVLRKTAEESTLKIKKEKKNVEVSELINQLKTPNDWAISIEGNKIGALPKNRVEDIAFLRKKLNIMHAGIPLAEQKGKDFIPQAALALSKNIDLQQVNTFETDLPTALRFLQKETVEIPQAARGYVLLMYKNAPLGWVKNLGNRANNLYPNEWRIRMRLT
jgi:NOL1/NOP2/fmu family ribosome biogenesis protein